MKSPVDAIEKANKGINEMKLDRFEAKEIAQSESTYYNTFAEDEQFHFTITILFVKEELNK